MLGRLGRLSLWLAALLFIAVAINSNEPYLVRLRGVGNGALLGVSIAVPVALIWRGAWRDGWIKGRMLMLVWCVPALAFATTQALFAIRKYETLHTDAVTSQLLGRHFVVGYASPDEAAALAERGLITGLYVTRHNAVGRSVEELKADVADLQRRRSAAGLPPLIVAADQEGGIVAHLSPPLPAEPALATLAGLPSEQRRQKAEELGRRQGAALAGIGVTLNLAPVVDIRPSWRRNRFDFNTLISQRAISTDPMVVSELAAAYVHGLETAGVGATVKHFPGLGRVAADTHHFAARLDASPADLDATDWRPFRDVLAGSQAALMVGHVTLTAVDPDRPASHSKAVIDGLLRRQWNYGGVIMTDDLVMGAIYGHDVCKAVVEALNSWDLSE